MFSSYYDEDLDMHVETLERCKSHQRYRVIEIHVPGIQGPGVGSGGDDSTDDDDIATDEDIKDLFPSTGTEDEQPSVPDTGGNEDDGYASDDDIKDLFP